MKLMEEIKALDFRFRDAEYANEKLEVRVFTRKGRNIIGKAFQKNDEKLNAEILSYLFSGEKVISRYTTEYLLCDGCFDYEVLDLIDLWQSCQFGTYKKKFLKG